MRYFSTMKYVRIVYRSIKVGLDGDKCFECWNIYHVVRKEQRNCQGQRFFGAFKCYLENFRMYLIEFYTNTFNIYHSRYAWLGMFISSGRDTVTMIMCCFLSLSVPLTNLIRNFCFYLNCNLWAGLWMTSYDTPR